LNTSTSIKDLDSETTPLPGQWYHLASVYNGKDMEIWLNGKLDAVTSLNGLINKTTYDLVFGQYLPGENGYNFNGSLDAVSIYDYALSAEQIADHMEHSIEISSIPANILSNKEINVFPNPVHGQYIHVTFQQTQHEHFSLTLYDITGKQLALEGDQSLLMGDSEIIIPVGKLENGIYLLSLTYKDKTDNELIIILR
jgi:hypothetical protein